MDGGEKERKVVEELKSIIKQTLKEKRLHRSALPTPSISATSFRYGESPLSLVAPIPTLSHTAESLSQISLNPYHCDYISAASLPSPSSPPNSGSESQHVVRTRNLKEVENSLLMNYLDYVFPLQFSSYTPLVTELGRGWLLTLLTRTKPLYHTALALSGLYMYSMLLKTGRTRCINGNWEVMRMNHEKAFSELQIQLRLMRVGDLKSTIETAACVIQLISFELLRGGTDSWQIYLSAASSLVPTLISHLSPLPSSPQSPTRSSISALGRFKLDTTGIAPDEMPPDLDDIACDFLVGTFIWFDILSCASTNSLPHLPSSYTYLESHKIQLHKIMGCENRVMALIAQISELSTWKTSQLNAGRLSIKELSSRGTEIERQLYNCLDDINKRIATLRPCGETSSYQNLGVSHSHTNLIKTRIFAFSALTYLHCTISSPHPSLNEIISSVTNSIEAFKELKESKMLRNLAWPFCVTACMALKEQEEFFEEFMQWIGREEGNFGSLWKGWEVVKECWRLRGEGKEVDWMGAMESLGFQVLLV